MIVRQLKDNSFGNAIEFSNWGEEIDTVVIQRVSLSPGIGVPISPCSGVRICSEIQKCSAFMRRNFLNPK